ncbi:hypothetical protein GOP47_0014019 [Adiantum capillus-veneris]|uniref:DYW domain-containing protein n=1 Tax=Adiantum capillus-veneris TaxID=13818 RepID=A0A9D4ZDS4_ADICA|nr:hypothetical protein GOP47_0014019 [Adiantum capillus-veneris]
MNAGLEATFIERASSLCILDSDKSKQLLCEEWNCNRPNADAELDVPIGLPPQAWNLKLEMKSEDLQKKSVKSCTGRNHAPRVESCNESSIDSNGYQSFKGPVDLDIPFVMDIEECKDFSRQEGNFLDSFSLEEAISFLDSKDEVLSIENYICSILKCRKRKIPQFGEHIYLLLCKSGLELQETLSNHCVPMLVDCESLPLALQFSKRLTYVSEHAWSSLILGLAEAGQLHVALTFYQRMQENGVHPSSHTIVTLLKICARLKAADLGRCLHVEITQRGLESDSFICNTLIHMYAKCDMLLEAKAIFDKLPLRTVVTWNALIAAYTEHGLYQEALKLSETMEKEGISPDAFSFACSLKACCSIGAIDKGRELHKKINCGVYKTDTFIGNVLVGMYAKYGSLSEAREVFDQLPKQDVVGWSALIAGYAEHGPFEEALKCFERMQLVGLFPDSITYASVLRVCASAGFLERGQELHMELVERGCELRPVLGNSLVGMYAKCGSFPEARKVLQMISVGDIVSWNAFITGLIEHGFSEEALDCFKDLRLHCASPDAVTFACSLKACSGMGNVQEGQEIHMQTISRGFEGDSLVGNTLIGMYSRIGFFPEALQVFKDLLDRDVVSWNALIAGYAEHDLAEEVLKCLEQMQVEGTLPDVATYRSLLKAYSNIEFSDKGARVHLKVFQMGLNKDFAIGNALINMYAKVGLLDQAQKVFDELSICDVVSWNALISGYGDQGSINEAFNLLKKMQLEGFSLDATSYACVIKACDREGGFGMGREIHMEITKKGMRHDVIDNALLGVYAKCGLILDAQYVFDRLLVPDVISSTSLIAGYAEHGPFEEALTKFDQMQSEGIFQNASMYACALKACSSLKNIDRGQETHAEVIKKGFDKDAGTLNTLLNMYAKCRFPQEAEVVFDKLPMKESVSWTALISGYSDSGLCKEALHCFDCMQQEGVSPNVVTYASVVKSCGSIGAIDKGHDVIQQLYQTGLDKDPLVVNSLIGMHSKCGQLSEARKVFDGLCSQDTSVWSSMIQGYGMNHEGGMAVQCFEDMQKQKIKPDVVTFTCLLNSCSHTSLIHKGLEYFKLMREGYGVAPREDHYTCFVDLLARSGKLIEAENFAEMMCPSNEGAWLALLTACRTCGEVELGSRCFEHLVCLNAESAAWYAIMVDIYADEGRLDGMMRLEDVRKHVAAKKKRASALIEVNKQVHEFVVGSNPGNDITSMLETLNSRLKGGGHMPNHVSHSVYDDVKETSMHEHAEKIAIAFGILNTPQGLTLRVTKNLRMCDDCHDATKVLSKVERREIILRDTCCIHHFKDGVCSCGDSF